MNDKTTLKFEYTSTQSDVYCWQTHLTDSLHVWALFRKNIGVCVMNKRNYLQHDVVQGYIWLDFESEPDMPHGLPYLGPRPCTQTDLVLLTHMSI